MLLDILLTTAPVFLLLLIGAVAVRGGAFLPAMIPGAGRLVMYLLMPALIFRALSSADIGSVFELHYLLAYGLGSLLAFVLVFLLSQKLRGSGVTQAGLHGMGGSMCNSAFFGLPILLQINESIALIAFSLALLVENLLTIPLSLAVAESGVPGNEETPMLQRVLRIMKRVLVNPLIMAIVLGVGFSVLSLPVPKLADQALGMLAAAAAPLALLTIGATLGNTRPGLPDGEFLLVGAGKLLLHPLLVWCLILLLPDFDPALQQAAIVMAAMPMFSLYAIISAGYGFAERGSVVLLYTTVASFLSINAILWLLAPFAV